MSKTLPNYHNFYHDLDLNYQEINLVSELYPKPTLVSIANSLKC